MAPTLKNGPRSLIGFTDKNDRECTYFEVSFWTTPADATLKTIKFVNNRILNSLPINPEIFMPKSKLTFIDHADAETIYKINHFKGKPTKVTVSLFLDTNRSLLEEETKRAGVINNKTLKTSFRSYNDMTDLANLFVDRLKGSELADKIININEKQ